MSVFVDTGVFYADHVDAVLSFDDDFDGIIERIDPADLV